MNMPRILVMKQMLAIAGALAFSFLAGCAKLAYCGSLTDLPKMEITQLCAIYGTHLDPLDYLCRTSEVRTELQKRKIFNEQEWEAIENKKFYIGMSKLAVLAVWGRPTDINRTVFKYGIHEQWVYGYYGGPYLYFDNGVLTSWQD